MTKLTKEEIVKNALLAYEQNGKPIWPEQYTIVKGLLGDRFEQGMEDFHGIGVVDIDAIDYNSNPHYFYGISHYDVTYVQDGDYLVVFNEDDTIRGYGELSIPQPYGPGIQWKILEPFLGDMSIKENREFYFSDPFCILATKRSPWVKKTVKLENQTLHFMSDGTVKWRAVEPRLFDPWGGIIPSSVSRFRQAKQKYLESQQHIAT